MTLDRDRLTDNVARVRERVAAACARAGRPADDVTLVAVTKTVAPATAGALVELGLADLGENRVPELLRKAEAVAGVRWHMIGTLQRNKVRRVLPHVALVHSVDSTRLARQVDLVAGEMGTTARVLLEVNTSGEAAKHGFAPDEVEPALADLADLTHVTVAGLMTMAAFVPDPEQTRPCFVALRELAERLRPVQPANAELRELSMGMSNDFEVAVEEGATLVRVGTALVDGVEDTGA